MWIDICHFTYQFLFIQNGIYYFVYSFVTCTKPLLSFCSVITVLTTIPIMKTKMKKKMRMRATKERLIPMMGNQLGLLFVRVQKLMVMCVVCITFTKWWIIIRKRRGWGLILLVCQATLPFFMTLPWVLSVSLLFSICINQFV